MTGATDWQNRTGDVWAAHWRQTDRSFAGLDPHLLTTATDRLVTGASVLDAGCGAGATALAIKAARGDCQLTGIDLSPALIAVAQTRAAERPADQRPAFRVEDAAAQGAEIFDRVVSRHGVMFFADPVAGLAALRRRTAGGGELVFTCFRARRLNEWATRPAGAVGGGEPAPADGLAGGPGPFAFAIEDEVAGLLAAAGWSDAAARAIDYDYVAGSGDDAVRAAAEMFSRIGPAAPLLAATTGAARQAAGERLHAICEAHHRDRIVSFPAAAWLWRARNAG